MHTTNQSANRPKIVTTAKVIDPAERQRRLWKVYARLLDLAEEQEAASPDTLAERPQAVG